LQCAEETQRCDEADHAAQQVMPGLARHPFAEFATQQQDRRYHHGDEPAVYRDHLERRHVGADQQLGHRVHDLEQQHRQQHQADTEQIVGLVT
jgi:hypothetical protein